MNGKIKVTGSLVAAILGIATAIYGYGALNARVDAVEREVPKLEIIGNRLTKIETIVDRIDKRMDKQDAGYSR